MPQIHREFQLNTKMTATQQGKSGEILGQTQKEKDVQMATQYMK